MSVSSEASRVDGAAALSEARGSSAGAVAVTVAAEESGATAAAAAARGEEARDEERLKEDVYTACAYGDLEKLRRLVEEEGHSLAVPDAGGYHALQWCALNNKLGIARYLLQRGVDLHVRDKTGQTALHWAAVRGSLQVADALLEAGADVEAADSHGYQITHVAAQYGQTDFLYHICSKWGAKPDALDNDGRSPLHWAAYKGFSDPAKLLLFLNANLTRPDKEGCTPMHWAAIRGNLEVCTVLVHAGSREDLLLTDATGSTPVQLAAEKGHRNVTLFLSNARRVFDSKLEGKDGCFGLARFGLVPLLWVIIVGLVFAFLKVIVVSPYLPVITSSMAAGSALAAAFAALGLFFLFKASTSDPGFVPLNGDHEADGSSMGDEDEELGLLQKNAVDPVLKSGRWSELCVTCRIVRPRRAKHCNICNRCVLQFDHHCPWISNCVGKRNKWFFIALLHSELVAMVLALVVSVLRLTSLSGLPHHLWPWLGFVARHHTASVAFIAADLFMLCSVFGLTWVQSSQVAQNTTTNEMINAHRYAHMKGPDGRYFNPYDRGCAQNCHEFWMTGENADVEVPWAAPQPANEFLKHLFGGQQWGHRHAHGDHHSGKHNGHGHTHGSQCCAKPEAGSKGSNSVELSTSVGTGSRERRSELGKDSDSCSSMSASVGRGTPIPKASGSSALGLGIGLGTRSGRGSKH